jgi:hypothetical protein
MQRASQDQPRGHEDTKSLIDNGFMFCVLVAIRSRAQELRTRHLAPAAIPASWSYSAQARRQAAQDADGLTPACAFVRVAMRGTSNTWDRLAAARGRRRSPRRTGTSLRWQVEQLRRVILEHHVEFAVGDALLTHVRDEGAGPFWHGVRGD